VCDKKEIIMKKLALLGPARPNYHERVEEIRKSCEYCWSGWSYKIDNKKERTLNDQLEKDRHFNIYIHDIRHPEHEEKYGHGTGYVEYRLCAEKYEYDDTLRWSPNPECTPKIDTEQKHRLYAFITKKPEPIIPHKKFHEFINFDTGLPLPKQYPFFGPNVRDKEFIYILDEKK
jgi:hypothetical protein